MCVPTLEHGNEEAAPPINLFMTRPYCVRPAWADTHGVKVPWPQLSVRGPSRRSGLRSDPPAQVTLNDRCKAAGCNTSELESAS